MDPSHQYYAVCKKVKKCIDKYLMSKEETERYLRDQQGITRQDTNAAWILLERMHPGLFTSYNARIHERNARTRERVASTSPRDRNSAILGEQEQQQRLSPRRGLRILLPDLNVPASSPQEAISVHPSTQAGPSRAANANAVENQNLQASLQQQPVIPNDFCQQVLNALGQIIQLLSDGRGLGPHPSSTGSLKRKRVGENEERGKIEGEKLQENESGGNEEEEEKLQDNEEGNGGEAEKVQENERDGDEEAEKPQENEEGNDEENAEE